MAIIELNIDVSLEFENYAPSEQELNRIRDHIKAVINDQCYFLSL